MKQKLDFGDVIQLSIITSSACDLKCSYCYLKESRFGSAYAKLNKEIQEALKNGQYVENIKKVFKAIGSNPAKLTNFEIWGGEPLLYTENLIKPMGELVQFFPNMNYMLIPTNWSRPNIDHLADFIMSIENHKNPNTKPLDLHLQLSIDGPPGPFNDNGHPAKWENYRENVTLLCEKFRGVVLNNIRVIFEIHPTAAKENILNYLDSSDYFAEYIRYMENFSDFIKKEINRCQAHAFMRGTQPIGPIIATPSPMTVEEGTNFERIHRIGEYAYKKAVPYRRFGEHEYFQLSRGFTGASILNKNSQCAEANQIAITIMPDGTLAECACSYIQNKDYFLQELLLAQKDKEYRISQIRKKLFINPLTATDKEIEDYNWYVLNAMRNTESTSLSLTMALVKELALSKQVDPAYLYDPDMLLTHASSAAQLYSCPREQINDTQILFVPTAGDCRKMFNGTVEFITNSRKAEAKFKVENSIKNARIPE